MTTIGEIKNKVYGQKFLIDVQRAAIGKLEADNKKLEKVKIAASNVLDNIHEDIFYKEPRGQVSIGQDVRWHRCKNLLDTADELREAIETLKGNR